jgi:hypothetical protein
MHAKYVTVWLLNMALIPPVCYGSVSVLPHTVIVLKRQMKSERSASLCSIFWHHNQTQYIHIPLMLNIWSGESSGILREHVTGIIFKRRILDKEDLYVSLQNTLKFIKLADEKNV